MQKEKIEYGDLVSFDVCLDNGNNLRMFGRVLGCMTPNLSTYFGSNNAYRYLVKTFLQIPEDDKEIDWVITGDHADVVHSISEKNFHLDWGHLPKILDETYLATVDESEIFQVIDKDNEKFFEQAGRCKRCGHKGEWISLALICPFHGKFMG